MALLGVDLLRDLIVGRLGKGRGVLVAVGLQKWQSSARVKGNSVVKE